MSIKNITQLLGFELSYVFDSFFCGFEEQLDEAEGGEPGTPEHDLLHRLHVHHAEDENKLVEEKVPEIRLEGKWLRELGFEIGDQIEIKQQKNKLTITLTEKKKEK